MEKHTTRVTVRECFDLGKNTTKDSGISIEVFGKSETGREPKLGTIEIGRGSFAWWARNKRKSTGQPTRRYSWEDFAKVMDDLAKGR